MAVHMTTYKDRPAVAVAGVGLTALLLPEDGGKMASLKSASGQEYLCRDPGAAYRRLTPEGSYVEAECSAFDDMFPTIDPCTFENVPWAGVEYPDHGEVCRLPMQWKADERGITLTCPSRLFPTVFEKRVAPAEAGLRITYTLRNLGDVPFPCLWAGHIMLAGEQDAVLATPYPGDAPIRMMFGPENALDLPRDRLLPFGEEGPAYKFYYTQPLPKGEMAVSYPSRGEKLTLTVSEDVKYLGVWLNCGSFKGLYNLALEPCTALYDRPDAALAAGCGYALPPGGERSFTLTFGCEKL